MPKLLTQLFLLFVMGLQEQGMGLSPNQTMSGLQGKLWPMAGRSRRSAEIVYGMRGG